MVFAKAFFQKPAKVIYALIRRYTMLDMLAGQRPLQFIVVPVVRWIDSDGRRRRRQRRRRPLRSHPCAYGVREKLANVKRLELKRLRVVKSVRCLISNGNGVMASIAYGRPNTDGICLL